MEDFASTVGPHPKGSSNVAHTSDGSQENYWMQMNQTFTTAPASGTSGDHAPDQVYQYYGQYYNYSNQYGNYYYYQDPYGQHQRSQKQLTCEVCNRSFFSEAKLQQHIEGHVKCPFPECGLEADMKIIDQHITNQHMLVNFEALQMDDEAWIAERKKRFPTAERAALRRAQQEQQLKRGERLQPNKKRFNKDAKPVRKPKVVDKKKPSSDEKTNETEQFKGRGRKGTWKKDENKEKISRPALLVDVDPYDSDPEMKRGVPAFRGTKQYYESTGEVSYFVNYNRKINEEEEEDLSEENVEDGLDISDEEEWQSEQALENTEATPNESTKIVLSNALGSLIGAYDSDSEEEQNMESHSIQPTVGAKEVVKQSIVTPNPFTQKETGEEVKSSETSHNLRENKGRYTRRRHGRRKRPAKDNGSENADSGITNDSRPRPKQPRFPRKRKATLLEKLLESDIRHERNVILQCIRYIVNNKFFDSAKETETKGGDKRDDKLNGENSIESELKDHLGCEKRKEDDLNKKNVEENTTNISDSKNGVEDRIAVDNEDGMTKVGLVNIDHMESDDIERKNVEHNKLGTETKNELETEDNMENGMEVDHQNRKNSVELAIDQMECETRKENCVQNDMGSKAASKIENAVEGMKVTNQKREDNVKSVTNGKVEYENEEEKTDKENEDVVVPACEVPQGHSTRELLEALVKTAWSASQEWAVAWKEGGQALKTLVAAQVTQEGKKAEDVSQKTQKASGELHGAILKMKKKVAILEDLHEQLQTLARIHADAPAPFITLTFHDMALLLGEVAREYSAETTVKECCLPILSTPSVSTCALNTCNTIWANHQHLRHNLFPIKALLHEIGAL